MNGLDIFMLWVCPSVGALIAFFMFASPLKAVLAADKQKFLGELNALPFIAMLGNGMGWIAYGLVIHDYFVYGTNIPGVLFGLFYVMTTYKWAAESTQDMMKHVFMGLVTVFLTVGLVHMGAGLGPRGIKTLWGSNAVAILGVYYAAPLSTIATVFRERDSSSLHWPMCMMNVINGLLWFAYGLATKDFFLIVPNGVGAAFNVVCLIISFSFPRKPKAPLGKGEQALPNNTVDQISKDAEFAMTVT